MTSVPHRCCSEPFRVFFPLAFFASIVGVLLWPLSLAGLLNFHPLDAHARWMIHGFGGCLIVGFVGTAGPRLMGSECWSRAELIWHTLMALSMLTALSFARILVADLLAGFWLLGVTCSMIGRLIFDRNGFPPPGMVLVFFGLITAIVSSFALALHGILGFSFFWHQFWRNLYFQGFLWLPVIGVAPYLIPRFFGLKSLHSFEEGRGVPKGWLKYWIISVISGTLLLASFAIEVWLNQKAGLYLRAFTVSAHLFAFVPGILSLKKCNALGLSIRWVPWCAAVGWLAIIFFPGLRTGVLHLMFIGGAAIVMLAVSTRVILGHIDRHDRLALPMKWYHLVWSLLLLTAATRLSADFVPKVRISHLSYAACLWLIVIVFWSVKIRRDLKSPLPNPSTRGNCPKRKRKR